MYTDPKTGAIYDRDEQGLLIECKNNVKEVWDVINHIEKYLNPPMINGVYPATRPGSKSGHRIEVNCLFNKDGLALINILIFPADWEIHDNVAMVLDEALTVMGKITLQLSDSSPPRHIRIKYEHI